jgi:hypothetical protein
VKGTLVPKWVDRFEEVESDIVKIQTKSTILQQFVGFV